MHPQRLRFRRLEMPLFSLGFCLFALVAMASGLAPRDVSVGWTPPIGIPEPAFGIREVHTMYAGKTFNFGAGPELYRDAGHGPYTHYVDRASPSATDSLNPYGTPQRPRLTIPGNLPPASVVEIHGEGYSFRNLADKMAVWGAGTATTPIFVRGPSPTEKAVLTKDLMVMGSYVIVENLALVNAHVSVRQDLLSKDIHHVSLRGLEIRGTGLETGNGGAVSIGLWAVKSAFTISDVVVSGIATHDFGSLDPTFEHDWVGVGVSGYDCLRIWIVDSDLYRLGGDSIRVGNNAGWTVSPTSRYVYIGRNRLHDNGENALDVKAMSDVVASQNVMYNFHNSISDPGVAIVLHYGPSNVWLLFNEVHHAVGGVYSSGVGELYLVGNVIRDVGEAIKFWGDGQISIVGNTISRVGSGIQNIGGSDAPKPLINNIIADITDESSGYHIRYNLTGLALASAMNNNLVFQNAGKIRIAWGGQVFESLSTFQAASGKGAGSIQGSPMFIDAPANDFRLAPGSPAVDHGADTSPYADLFYSRFGEKIDLDMQGRRRPIGPFPDIGSYEFGPSRAPTSPTNLRIK